MRKKICFVVALMLLGAMNVSSGKAGDGDKINTAKNLTSSTIITWKPVDNVQTACEAESRTRGLGGFHFKLDACAFWSKSFMVNHCLIITSRITDHRILGHETLHCFQHAFHR